MAIEVRGTGGFAAERGCLAFVVRADAVDFVAFWGVDCDADVCSWLTAADSSGVPNPERLSRPKRPPQPFASPTQITAPIRARHGRSHRYLVPVAGWRCNSPE